MNFQEKMIETTTELRARAAALATGAIARARVRAQLAAKRVESLKGSISALKVAGRELNKVARRHAVRFVKENSSLAADAGKDVSALARSTYVTLAQRAPAKRAPIKRAARKATAARKRTASKAA
jgi:sugar phosphate isomerase/epimerase